MLLLCAIAPATKLAEGMTLAWATPISKVQLVPVDDPDLSLVSSSIWQAWMSHLHNWTSASVRQEGQSANDKFFDLQRQGFEAGGKHLLARLGGDAHTVLQKWHRVWQQAIFEYVAASTGEEAARALSARRLALFAWAGVQERCSPGHSGHFHEDSVVSGAFYLTPASSDGGGAWFADDPRGPRPPFDNRMRHHPRPGELVLFPSWLRHGIEPLSCEGSPTDPPRIAIAFNLGEPPPPSVWPDEGTEEARESQSGSMCEEKHTPGTNSQPKLPKVLPPMWWWLADVNIGTSD
jgi:hypothetical protein